MKNCYWIIKTAQEMYFITDGEKDDFSNLSHVLTLECRHIIPCSSRFSLLIQL